MAEATQAGPGSPGGIRWGRALAAGLVIVEGVPSWMLLIFYVKLAGCSDSAGLLGSGCESPAVGAVIYGLTIALVGALVAWWAWAIYRGRRFGTTFVLVFQVLWVAGWSTFPQAAGLPGVAVGALFVVGIVVFVLTILDPDLRAMLLGRRPKIERKPEPMYWELPEE